MKEESEEFGRIKVAVFFFSLGHNQHEFIECIVMEIR